MTTRRPRLTGPVNPIQTFLLAAAALSGASYLLGITKPGSVELILSPSMRAAWALLLTFGGTVALAGQYWPGRPFTSVTMERLGLAACAGGTFAYGVGLILVFPRSGGGVAVTNMAFAAACVIRSYQLTRLLRVAQNFAAQVDRNALPVPPDPTRT